MGRRAVVLWDLTPAILTNLSITDTHHAHLDICVSHVCRIKAGFARGTYVPCPAVPTDQVFGLRVDSDPRDISETFFSTDCGGSNRPRRHILNYDVRYIFGNQ
jgi:hypothetical protein